MGTYWSEARSPGILYGEGQGIIMTNDGTEVATWKGSGIGRMSGVGKVSFRGAIYWSTASTDKLAPLNNVVGIFEYEVDEGNTSAKVWEWK